MSRRIPLETCLYCRAVHPKRPAGQPLESCEEARIRRIFREELVRMNSLQRVRRRTS